MLESAVANCKLKLHFEFVSQRTRWQSVINYYRSHTQHYQLDIYVQIYINIKPIIIYCRWRLEIKKDITK